MDRSEKEERNKRSTLENMAALNEASKAWASLNSRLMSSAGMRWSGAASSQREAFAREMKDGLDSFSENVIWTTMEGNIVRGRDAMVEDILRTFETFPGIQIGMKEMAAFDNQVAALYLLTGTCTNGFMGLEPIDRKYRLTTFGFYNFDDKGDRTKAAFVRNPLEVYFQLGFPSFSIAGTPGTTTAPCVPSVVSTRVI